MNLPRFEDPILVILRGMATKGRRGGGRRPPDDLVETLEEVADLVEREEWVEARRALEPALARQPSSLDALAALATIAFELDDAHDASHACERLYDSAPDDPEVALAAGFVFNGASALFMVADGEANRD